MITFTSLIKELDGTTSTTKKIQFLSRYFSGECHEKDKLWAIALFTGRRPRRTVQTAQMRQWCAELAGIPLWLFEQNYHIVGDLAETIALIVSRPVTHEPKELHIWIQEIQNLKQAEESEKKTYVLHAWQTLSADALWVFNKLITGGFRIGVSKNIIIHALSLALDKDANTIAYHLTGQWDPEQISWQQLFNFDRKDADISRPYPFYLAYPLQNENLETIHAEEWVAEWKWDGIRVQLILRRGNMFLWSRGEELISDKFPEFKSLENLNMDFVLDGEMVTWNADKPGDFQKLQTRIGRKNPGKKLLSDIPVKFIAYDLLEYEGIDIRSEKFSERRSKLETLVRVLYSELIILSPLVSFKDKDELNLKRIHAKESHAEGLMLKKKTGLYLTGRKSGEMWKWKTDPFVVDAVLIYAQRGHGRRANLFSDFTFAVWDEGKLVPFAKAYSGLTDQEMREVTAFVRSNTTDTFGPVSSVKPFLVFELAFEGISLSSRHKSGIAVRFPRISRWRKDKGPENADHLAQLKKWLK